MLLPVNMPCTDNIEQKLGFDQLREMLRGYTLCPLGAERVDAMYFSDDTPLIRRSLQQTAEMVRLLSEREFPTEGFVDARATLQKMRIDGAYAEGKELAAIQRSLQGVCDVSSCLRTKQEGTDICRYNELSRLADGIVQHPDLIRAIEKVVDNHGEVRDNASPNLLRIRRELQGERNRMTGLMQRVLLRAKNEGLVDEDAAPALRDGRLVIPIAAERKRKLPGIVHDISDTGRTAYVEPTEVVEATARLLQLENEERREIIAILRATATLIRPHIPNILHSYTLLANADFIRAKALLAKSTHGELPAHIDDTPLIDWAEATHPLLRIALERQGKPTVPLSILLSQPTWRILLISGPNAGGKSVCLKTVGLLQYMLQCGLLPPFAPSSRCGTFRQILLSIGDEQDLNDDLSTYSAHLLRMKQMLRSGDKKTLLLVDEFGSGTEPQMGAALSEAILGAFLTQGCFAVITTHYHNLKVFAANHEGIQNAAMLYDRQAMTPLFLLQTGNPGSSFAIEIAHKTGLPTSVIDEAKRIAGEDLVHFDKFLQDINRDKRYWERKRAEVHQREKQLLNIQEEYARQLTDLQSQRKQILDDARVQAQRLMDESKARIERTIREIKEAQAEREQTKALRAELDQWATTREQTDEQDAKITAKIRRIQRRRARKRDKQPTVTAPQTPEQTAEHTSEGTVSLQEGAYVNMPPHTSPGIILKIHGKEALVAFGDVQINAKLSSLKPCPQPSTPKRNYTTATRQTLEGIRETKLQFSPEINVMGMRAEEALHAVTLFLDDALVSGSTRLRILHGTGTGALKTAIRQYLSTRRGVLHYQDEHPQFGGAGVTVVDIN